jgi:hypothetical protein
VDLRWKLRLAAITAACACCSVAHAQVFPASATADAQDLPMPADRGAPLVGPPAAAPAPAPGPLTVDSPIQQIAANPQGRAVLERTLPGLCERPEYPMFKTLSLKRLAGMSNGRITEAKLDTVQTDLSRLGPVEPASAPSHGALYPIVHTATYSVRYGGRQIGHISRSIYHRVVLVIASL